MSKGRDRWTPMGVLSVLSVVSRHRTGGDLSELELTVAKAFEESNLSLADVVGKEAWSNGHGKIVFRDSSCRGFLKECYYKRANGPLAVSASRR